MVPALTLKKMEDEISKKYGKIDNKIIGIFYARYDIPQIKEIIEYCYQYWHENSGRDFDIFWIGYGKYVYHESKSMIPLELLNNMDGIFYDIMKFIEFKNQLEYQYHIPYNDRFEIVLINCHKGVPNYNENIKINLGQDPNYIRPIIEDIIRHSKNANNINYLKDILKNSIAHRDSDYL